MTVLYAIGAALLGAVLGSFVNALSWRWGTGVSIVAGRSRCMRCGHALGAGDMVPVLSWAALGGRCRYCGSRIHWQYPAVEAAGVALSLGAWWIHPDPAGYALWLAAWMVLLLVAVYDLRHKVIPWSFSLVLVLLALARVWSAGADAWSLSAGPALALPLFALWLVSRGRWMGLGDAGLMLGLGWLLGPTAGLTGFVLAFWAGAAVGIALMLARRGVTMRSEVPFAPFLILGAAAAHFLHVDLFQSLPLLFQ